MYRCRLRPGWGHYLAAKNLWDEKAFDSRGYLQTWNEPFLHLGVWFSLRPKANLRFTSKLNIIKYKFVLVAKRLSVHFDAETVHFFVTCTMAFLYLRGWRSLQRSALLRNWIGLEVWEEGKEEKRKKGQEGRT